MPACQHSTTEFMMRRDGIDYIRCVGCDQVFEAEDLEQAPLLDDPEDQPLDQEDEPRRKKAS